MNISTTDAQALFTKMLIDVYVERPKPTAFLRSFFPTIVSPTKEISIEVERGTEKIAVDVMRGSDGNRNTFDRSTEKIFIPPYFREWFDATQLALYDRLYGATEINDAIFAAYINSVADKQMTLQAKIERSIELMCAQVLETGIVTLTNGDNIDFKRKAASIKNPGSGNYWANDVNLYAQLEEGCQFIRREGRSTDGVFNCILGTTALTDLLSNAVFLERQNLFNMALDQVIGPMKNAEGATFHGILTVGAYKLQLWAYDQTYDAANGTKTPYVNPKNATIIPTTPRFKTAFAGVPQLIRPGQMPVTGAFIFNDYIDERGKAHVFDVESAPVPVPVAVDTIYTLKAVA
jgi:hypothetical protein